MVNLSNQESLGAVEAKSKEDQLKKLTDYFDITDNGVFLKQGMLKSKNFVKNLKGWGIDSEGNAWFKSVTAGAYVQVFIQAAIPTSLHVNDLWYDSDDSNKLYKAACAGATTIAAGKWELVDLTVEWADVADGASTKPDDNATVGATAGTDLKDSGAVVLSDTEVKNIVSINYGETIAGATLPVPVYVNNTDSEVYKCDANASGKLKFFGFALSNKGDGESGKVQVIGIVPGFTGLTVGAIYYISDTAGTISTTPGTLGILVGKAVSATQIKIIDQPNGLQVAGDNLLNSADTNRNTTSQNYEKQKEFQCTESGIYRVKFDLCSNDASYFAYGRIYKNGVALGTEQSTKSLTPVTKSEDLTFVEGDLIQLYAKHAYAGDTTSVSNFRIYIGGKNSILLITD